LFEILKIYICLSFHESEFDFVTKMFYNEINNGLFNRYISHFVNFIVILKVSVNLEEFNFLKKIDNDLKVLLK
jgi:hypothetical protein